MLPFALAGLTLPLILPAVNVSVEIGILVVVDSNIASVPVRIAPRISPCRT
jgi:hypothetical protein